MKHLMLTMLTFLLSGVIANAQDTPKLKGRTELKDVLFVSSEGRIT